MRYALCVRERPTGRSTWNAAISCPVLAAGLYVEMNGMAFLWDRVRNNTQTGFFEGV